MGKIWCVLVFVLVGCGGGSAPGRVRTGPVPASSIPVGTVPDSDPAGIPLRGGSPAQRATVASAIRKVDATYQDASFWSLVRGMDFWLREADASDSRYPSIVSGETVADSLSKISALNMSYQLVRVFRWYNPWRWIFAGRTTAMTGACGEIRILRRQIGSDESLVNTIAHEVTHLLAMGQGELGCTGTDRDVPRYTDSAPQPLPAKAWLVSYAIGDLAQCYLRMNADPQATLACFAWNVNDTHVCRLEQECCEPTSLRLVVDIRAKSARCAGYRDAAGCARAREVCAIAEAKVAQLAQRVNVD